MALAARLRADCASPAKRLPLRRRVGAQRERVEHVVGEAIAEGGVHETVLANRRLPANASLTTTASKCRPSPVTSTWTQASPASISRRISSGSIVSSSRRSSPGGWRSVRRSRCAQARSETTSDSSSRCSRRPPRRRTPSSPSRCRAWRTRTWAGWLPASSIVTGMTISSSFLRGTGSRQVNGCPRYWLSITAYVRTSRVRNAARNCARCSSVAACPALLAEHPQRHALEVEVGKDEPVHQLVHGLRILLERIAPRGQLVDDGRRHPLDELLGGGAVVRRRHRRPGGHRHARHRDEQHHAMQESGNRSAVRDVSHGIAPGREHGVLSFRCEGSCGPGPGVFRDRWRIAEPTARIVPKEFRRWMTASARGRTAHSRADCGTRAPVTAGRQAPPRLPSAPASGPPSAPRARACRCSPRRSTSRCR